MIFKQQLSLFKYHNTYFTQFFLLAYYFDFISRNAFFFFSFIFLKTKKIIPQCSQRVKWDHRLPDWHTSSRDKDSAWLSLFGCLESLTLLIISFLNMAFESILIGSWWFVTCGRPSKFKFQWASCFILLIIRVCLLFR